MLSWCSLDRPTKTKNNYLLDVVLRYQFAQVVQAFVHPIPSSLLDDAVRERVLRGGEIVSGRLAVNCFGHVQRCKARERENFKSQRSGCNR